MRFSSFEKLVSLQIAVNLQYDWPHEDRVHSGRWLSALQRQSEHETAVWHFPHFSRPVHLHIREDG